MKIMEFSIVRFSKVQLVFFFSRRNYCFYLVNSYSQSTQNVLTICSHASHRTLNVWMRGCYVQTSSSFVSKWPVDVPICYSMCELMWVVRWRLTEPLFIFPLCVEKTKKKKKFYSPHIVYYLFLFLNFCVHLIHCVDRRSYIVHTLINMCSALSMLWYM